jgi:nitroreductase
MPTLALTTDEVLTTTRSVRRRLDLERPVARPLIEECLRIAQQAPTGSNWQNWHFVVVTDPHQRAAVAELYRRGFEIYRTLPIAALNLPFDDPARKATQARVFASLEYLADHFHEVPAYVLPCFTGRVEGQPPILAASMYSSVSQAGWSFMLAARARGLASCWTTIHLFFEEEAAAILGLPYGEVTQGGLITLAHARGTDFKPAPRDPLSAILHWDTW